MDGTMVLKLEGDLRQDIVNGSVHEHAYDPSCAAASHKRFQTGSLSIILVCMICHYISISFINLII
jgi:hypothetical protein